MASGKAYYLSFAIGITLILGACSDNVADKGNVPDSGRERSNASVISLIDFVRKQKLINFPSSTIGNAFDSYRYLNNKEWKGEFLKSGHFTVDFVGWLDRDTLTDKDAENSITGRGFEITFVIEPNGSFYIFMINLVETKRDGKLYRNQLSDHAGVLASIYGNRKLAL